ncbi:hypothetical protein [Paenibacillus popilliae]|nr:hypothetical protein [Paenibacillus popilliae]
MEVDTWLEEDRLLPRKQRHTGVRIFQRLQTEYAFAGGQRTVLAYVKRRKSEMELERAKSYERLVVSFPYSNTAFVYPTPAENQECFLEGMKQSFQ